MIGFVVEGPSDEKVVKEICRKLTIRAEPRLMRGGYNPRRSQALSKMLLSGGCDKVIVLKGSHSSDPLRVRREIESKQRFTEKVRLCIVVHAIESWLIADENAIGDYLGIRIEKIGDPETCCKPEELLEKIFEKKGREYYKNGRDPAEIAKGLSLSEVAEKCASFREFSELLKK